MTTRNQEINTGIKWATIAKVALALIALIKISVLSRYLSADAFGLMAIVMIVIGFLDLFMDMGITSAILHYNEITKKEYGGLYCVSLIVGCFVCCSMYFLAPIVAHFYGEKELTSLIMLASVGVIIASLGRQFITIDQKELRFFRMAVIEVIASLISLIVAIYLAIAGFGVYSLVTSMLVQYSILNITYLCIGIRESKISFNFQLFKIWPFLKIGLFQVFGSGVGYLNKELDVILVGKLFGTEALGGYSLAKQLVNKPVSIVNPIINRVGTPILSLMQKDVGAVKPTFFLFTRIVSSINILAYGAMIFLAYPLVLLLYGESYLHITILVQVLSVYMFLRSLGNPVGGLVIAMGRTDFGLYWNLYATLFVPIAVFSGGLFGMVGVAIGLVLTNIFLTLSRWHLVIRKLTGASFVEYMQSLIPSYVHLKNLIQGRITFD